MLNNFRPILDILRDCRKWLWSGKSFLALVVVPAGAVALLWFMPWCKERDARILGVILQFIGFVSLVQIYNREAHTSEGISLQNWCQNWPKFRRKPAVLVAAASHISVTGTATATSRSEVGPNATVEYRVHWLEQDLKALREEVDTKTKRLLKDIRRIDELQNTTFNTVTAKLEAMKDETRLSTSIDLLP